MNADPDDTFTYFPLAVVVLSECQRTVTSTVFIYSGYHPGHSDSFSGFTEFTKCGGTKPLPRTGGPCFQ